MKCKHNDCFTCPYPDCINDYVRPYNAEYRKEYHAKHADENSARLKQVRAERKANGICTNCGKRPSEQGKTRCTECLLKLRQASIKRNRKQGRVPRELFDGIDLCIKCGRNHPVNGYKLCESCLEKARDSIAYGRSIRNKEEYQNFTK